MLVEVKQPQWPLVLHIIVIVADAYLCLVSRICLAVAFTSCICFGVKHELEIDESRQGRNLC